MPVSVYYVGESGDLVARTLEVDAVGDRMEEALALAATTPHDAGLRQAVPAGAFTSVSFDGIGNHGQVGVVLADPSMLDAQPGMSPAEARRAIRAAVCTVQIGAHAPVHFFLNGTPVSRLFGQSLPRGIVEDGRCP